MIISKIAPEPSKVTDKIAFCGRLLPNLGLACRGEFPFRAYVLKCAGPRPNSPCFYYVGITWAGNIAKRIREADHSLWPLADGGGVVDGQRGDH